MVERAPRSIVLGVCESSLFARIEEPYTHAMSRPLLARVSALARQSAGDLDRQANLHHEEGGRWYVEAPTLTVGVHSGVLLDHMRAQRIRWEDMHATLVDVIDWDLPNVAPNLLTNPRARLIERVWAVDVGAQ